MPGPHAADYKVEIVDASGAPDMQVSVVGDQVVSLVGATAGDVLTVQSDGTVAPESVSAGTGAVVGPASVTDDLPAVFDGTTGKLIKQKTYAAFKTLLALVKGDVGLGNVDNTSDAGKPVSTAQQTALNLKADLASPALTGNPTAPTASPGDADTSIATTGFVAAAVVAATLGLFDDRGGYDASVNTFPAAGGSGTAGAVLKGDVWTVTVAGTLGGVAVVAGDLVRALADAPGQTAGNWSVAEHNLGYIPENIANKDTDGTLAANSDTKYVSQRAVKTYADTKVAKSLFDANTVLAATTDDTPAAVTMAASTMLARLASGNIVAATVEQIWALLTMLPRNPLTTGQETFSRIDANTAVSLSTGIERFAYFTARKSETTTQVRLYCTTGWTVAAPTVLRFALYSVAANGDLTEIANTAHDGTLLAANNTPYTKAWQASVALTAGTRYAFGALAVLGAGTAPQIKGINPVGGSEMGVDPRISGAISGLSNLASSPISAATVGDSGNSPYAVILP